MRPITPFSFKQFSISHDKCAHKVGTDGVLLGAWSNAKNAKYILDIGTGSGLIALMLAQRFPKSTVTGIELHKPSFLQASENASTSPFAERLNMINGDFLHFAFAEKYDLIVSNPPFYKGNTSTGKSERDRARHEEYLPQPAFLAKATELLSPKGRLAVILPKEEGELFIKEAQRQGLYLIRLTRIFGSPNAPEKRWLLELSFENLSIQENHLTIRDESGSRSEEYQILTKDFYL
ncbi:tRNA1(Val) (adenine(37)-N6)-methyltransferase [Owenweeksia hongkongensis]|uniref:tRNA1(Val) (adenine(37)-N6)-methyltransferase n=1 Tax=Owenweeksia hongkongensis TaxID=253245 RepID=UPI003A8CE25F